MPTSKNQRALLIICELDAGGKRSLKDLYRFLERSGVSLATAALSNLYASTTVLVDNTATLNNFTSSLKRLADDRSIKAIDVILMLHGNLNKLSFASGNASMDKVEEKIRGLKIGNKLRMLYSTACFGYSHTDDFIAAGFDCASGSVAVNANSPVEYPVFLSLWAGGLRFSDCINRAENLLASAPFDAAARFTFPDLEVNSNKEIKGNGNVTINS